MALGCVLGMGLILPLLASDTVREFPEVAYLRWPVLVLCEIFMTAALVVLGCMWVLVGWVLVGWVLVGMVGREAVFSVRAFRYVDTVIAAFLLAALIAGSTLLWVVEIVAVGGAGVALLGVAATTGCLAGATLMALIRGLLVKATSMSEFMAEVV